VLNVLKEKSGFRTDLPRGEGMGVAIMEDHASICGACATVTVSRRGQLTVEKVMVVINSQHIINPLNCAEQLEGAVCWELGTAWYAGLQLDDGAFTNTNIDTYQLMRINQMPPVEVHFALTKGGTWGGMGEPAGPPTPGAVANAIFYATGKRIRSTPFRNHDLSWG
jgi:isoquinoline 1-oxidoreductase beta subunit